MTTVFKCCAIGVLIAASVGGLAMQRAGIIELRNELIAAREGNVTHRHPPSGPTTHAPNVETDLGLRVDPELRIAVDELPWKNKGNASPDSALETAMWASSRGDVDTIARLLVLEPKAREITESVRANLPDSSRTQFPTDESLVALLLAGQAPLKSIEVMGRSDLANGGVLLQVALAGPTGTSKQTEFAFVKEADGWHLVVTSELASHAAHLLRR